MLFQSHKFGKVGKIDIFDFSGSITREQNVFNTQITPLFFSSDVENELQARFPQNKLSSALYKIR